MATTTRNSLLGKREFTGLYNIDPVRLMPLIKEDLPFPEDKLLPFSNQILPMMRLRQQSITSYLL